MIVSPITWRGDHIALMKKAADFINEIFTSIHMDEEQDAVSLFQSWEMVVGTDIAAHSHIHELEGATLIIYVDHPGWIQMIDLRKRSILRKIRIKYPELDIQKILLRLG